MTPEEEVFARAFESPVIDSYEYDWIKKNNPRCLSCGGILGIDVPNFVVYVGHGEVNCLSCHGILIRSERSSQRG